ncbi:MAG: radical SAM protein [Candidatus Adiutrix sp.]|jgi:sulfatase maturation enzyme AslB (radical SAM superfamily)|nr:radical SAM protein [Candidatus Adiutrix sp.]
MDQVTYRSPTYYELGPPPELDWRIFRGPDYQDYRREWDERALRGEAGGFPLHLDVDPTNRCNLACPVCPRTHYLKTGRSAWNPAGVWGDMDFTLFERLIEEGAAEGLRSVKLNFLGEPLLAPRLTDMIRLAAGAGLWVMLNTNATLLTEAKAEALLAAGLSDIFFSFDSPYKAEYEKARPGADYAGVLANIRAFMAVRERLGRKEVQTRASMILPEEADPESLARLKADYTRLFRDLGVAEIGFGLASSVGRNYGRDFGLQPGFVCPDLFRRLFVFWDGPAGPCCGDWDRRLLVGRADRQSLGEIWRGEAYHELRAAHLAGRYGDIPACRACSVPYLSTRP